MLGYLLAKLMGFIQLDILSRSQKLVLKYEMLCNERLKIQLEDQQLKSEHDSAVKEFELLNREQQKILLKEKEATKAYEMLVEAFKVMEEEKLGVLGINDESNSTFNELQKEHKILQCEKDEIIKKDKCLAKKYNDCSEQLTKFEEERKSLQTKVAELDWQTCLLNNEV